MIENNPERAAGCSETGAGGRACIPPRSTFPPTIEKHCFVYCGPERCDCMPDRGGYPFNIDAPRERVEYGAPDTSARTPGAPIEPDEIMRPDGTFAKKPLSGKFTLSIGGVTLDCFDVHTSESPRERVRKIDRR